MIDQYFQSLAMDEARIALAQDEVPIGALVVVGPVQAEKEKRKNHSSLSSSYRILSRQHNRVEQSYDASAHAELLALRFAAKRIQNWRLSNSRSSSSINSKNHKRTTTTATSTATASTGTATTPTTTTLYTTLEPCVMCCASAQAFRVNRIVYGAKDIRLGAIESHRRLLHDNIRHPYHEITEIVGGVYANESQALLQLFFQSKRQQQKKEKILLSSKKNHQERPSSKWYRGLLLSPLRWFIGGNQTASSGV